MSGDMRKKRPFCVSRHRCPVKVRLPRHTQERQRLTLRLPPAGCVAWGQPPGRGACGLPPEISRTAGMDGGLTPQPPALSNLTHDAGDASPFPESRESHPKYRKACAFSGRATSCCARDLMAVADSGKQERRLIHHPLSFGEVSKSGKSAAFRFLPGSSGFPCVSRESMISFDFSGSGFSISAGQNQILLYIKANLQEIQHYRKA